MAEGGACSNQSLTPGDLGLVLDSEPSEKGTVSRWAHLGVGNQEARVLQFFSGISGNAKGTGRV